LKTVVLCWYVLVCSGFGFGMAVFDYDTRTTLYGGFLNYAKLIRLEIGLEEVSFAEGISVLSLITTSISLVLRLHKWLLIDFVASLATLTAFIALKICSRFKDLMIRFEHEEERVTISWEYLKAHLGNVKSKLYTVYTYRFSILLLRPRKHFRS